LIRRSILMAGIPDWRVAPAIGEVRDNLAAV
jgi:hypothetical protein